MDQKISRDKALEIKAKTLSRLEKYGEEKDPSKKQLLMLEDEIDDYASLLKSREKDKTFSISTLLRVKLRIKWRLNYLKDKISTEEPEQEFIKLNKQLEVLKNQDENYLKESVQNLKNYLERYEWYLKDLFKWEPEELDDMFSSRDNIEILKQEIKDPQKLRKIKKELEELDEKLKKHAAAIKDKIMPNNLQELYPKSFWWRHLKETK